VGLENALRLRKSFQNSCAWITVYLREVNAFGAHISKYCWKDTDLFVFVGLVLLQTSGVLESLLANIALKM
jgi:hypothetical protein